MHFHLVDSYLDTGSLLHRLDPRLKVALAFVMIVLIGLTPVGGFGAYVGFFAIMMVGALIARVDPLLVVRRSLVALPFAAAAITLVFTVPGPSLGTVPVVGWTISEPGLIRFASIMFKSTVSVQVAVLLIVSTHFTDMLWALGALRVPKVLVAVISFMYRYIFVLAEEAMRLTRARDSRSAAIGKNPVYGGSVVFQARTMGRMIGNLFVRGFERSERVYQAMVARGYQGEMLRLSAPPLSTRDVLAVLIPAGAGTILLALSILFR
jgi:cobalt/nickel transport system permease protein